MLTNCLCRLGNLDLVVILQSCIEAANGGAFIRKVTSTSKCWPTGHVEFRWLLRGTLAEGRPAAAKGSSPSVRRRKSVKQFFSPIKRLSLGHSLELGKTISEQQLPPPASPTTPSRLERWKSSRRRSSVADGICASPTTKPHEERRSSAWKERTSSLFQSKRQSHNSTWSQSTSSSWYSRRSTDAGDS